MTHLVTRNFRIHSADQFIESINEQANTIYYVYASQHGEFPDDQNPPTANDTVSEISYRQFDKMIFGKRVEPNDTSYMVKRVDWASNTVYDKYDPLDNELFTTKNFFVVHPEAGAYHVFKCLNNNNGQPSNSPPLASETSANAESYILSDGYQWKWMYSIPENLWNKFTTADYMPVNPNANVINGAVEGAIDVILVANSGSKYNSYANGYFTEIAPLGNTFIFGIDAPSANNDFYKNCALYIKAGTGAGQMRTIDEYIVAGGSRRVVLDGNVLDPLPDLNSQWEITPEVKITGNGTGARARALVNSGSSNSIFKVEVINRGSGYTIATGQVIGNTGTLNIISNTFNTSNATVNIIVSPPMGHGSNPNDELNASQIGISVTFANTENNTIPVNNDYRSLGIIRNPLFREVTLELANTTGVYAIGETIKDNAANSLATGKITSFDGSTLEMTNVFGFFSPNNYVSGLTSNATSFVDSVDQVTTTFDQRTIFQVNVTSGTFQEDEIVSQTTPIGVVTGRVHFANSSIISLTEVNGTFELSDINTKTFVGQTSNAVAELNGVILPDLVKYRGEIIYVENFIPITRSNSQSENIKLIVKF